MVQFTFVIVIVTEFKNGKQMQQMALQLLEVPMEYQVALHTL
jgi:hypothetical protein